MTYAVDVLKADVIAQMDADLSHDPASLPEFFKKYRKALTLWWEAGIYRAAPYPKNWGIHRKIFSIVGNSIVRFGLGFSRVHDWTGGYRVFEEIIFRISEAKKSQNTAGMCIRLLSS